MKTLALVLCYVSFLVTAAAHLELPKTYANTEDHAVRETVSEIDTVVSATTLVVVWMENCHWCDKFEAEVAIPLLLDGYDVLYINRNDTKYKPRMFPALYYLDADGNVVLEEVGYKTAEHVKKCLKK